MDAQSKPGLIYVIESDCSQRDIPYGDNFYVQNRYCPPLLHKKLQPLSCLTIMVVILIIISFL